MSAGGGGTVSQQIGIDSEPPALTSTARGTNTDSRNWFVLMPAILVLAALFIDVAAGRWGAYIRTPINGLYLPDALLALGALSALPSLRLLRALPLRIILVFMIPVLYILARVIQVLVTGAHEEPYLIVRDLAPYAYLAIVPLLVLALRRVKFSWLLWLLRIATLLQLVGVFAVTWGLLHAFQSDILGGGDTGVFYYRGDLQGVILGIGLIVWGSWPGSTNGLRVVQFIFLLGGMLLGSRAAFVTFIFCAVIALLRERKWFAPWKFILLAATALLASLVVSYAATTISTPETPTAASPSVPEHVARAVPGAAKLVGYEDAGEGTSAARLATYDLILDHLGNPGFLAFGSGPGTGVLYTICTGAPEAPARTMIVDNGQNIYLPKCPVDDSNAATTLRDPHNWLLNWLIYNGLAGTLVLLAALLLPIWVYRKSNYSSLPISVIAAYFVCGSFGVIISAAFGMLPVTVMLAWLIASSGKFVRT